MLKMFFSYMDISSNTYKVHKVIAKRGFCSTREAEKLIQEKRVKIHNEMSIEIAHIGQKISLNTVIEIDNTIIKMNYGKDVTYVLNKPIGYECSKKTHHNKNASIFSLLPHNSKLMTIGRLDVKTSGLIILTTNGKLTQEIIHPSNNIIKTYIIRIQNKLSNEDEATLLTTGIEIEGSFSKPKRITFKGEKKKCFEYEVEVHEGKKHIVRKFFGEFGYIVKSLKRTKIGNLDLFKLNLKEGEYKEIREKLLLKYIGK